MAWVLLVMAGLFEVGMAYGLKESHGFSQRWPTLMFIVFGAASFICLSLTLRHIPIGTSYAVWTGIGVTGTALIGMLTLGESRDPLKVGSLTLLVIALIGLRLSEAG